MNSTGNKSVDMMGTMNITGNIIPTIWCRTICNSSGKPCLNAIMILSDIVYWYRPREIRDESTGCIIRLEKKFRADLLQRNYQDFANQFGLSKKQVKEAFDILDDNLHIVYREWRTLDIGGRAMNNVLFIGLNVDKLSEHTFPENPDSKDLSPVRDTPSLPKREEGHDTEMTSPLTSAYGAVPPEVGTNTENTPKTTDRDISYPIYLSMGYTKAPSSPGDPLMDRMESIKTLVKRNLELDAMLGSFRYENEKRRFTEIYELICDVISQSSGSIRIGHQDKPIEVVKSVFLKLTHEHVLYVMDALEKTTSEIKNIRAYLITALYRAPQTMDNCITQQVTHDIIVNPPG